MYENLLKKNVENHQAEMKKLQRKIRMNFYIFLFK